MGEIDTELNDEEGIIMENRREEGQGKGNIKKEE